MDGRNQDPPEDPRQLAELSALADGTLDPARRDEVQARIDRSEDLRRRFEDEQRAVALLTAARERDRAPALLRERIESSRNRGARATGSRRRSPMGGVVAVAGIAAVLIVLALTLPTGSPGSPSLAQAAALGALGPNLAAPQVRATRPTQLRLGVGQLHFPNWSPTIGWRAIGQRRDRLHGRTVLTVYYARAAQTVAYSIVAGRPLPRPGASGTSSGAYYLQFFRVRGRRVVTWREAGHTCLLSGAGLSEHLLAALVAHA